jgi:hypothetical protein
MGLKYSIKKRDWSSIGVRLFKLKKITLFWKSVEILSKRFKKISNTNFCLFTIIKIIFINFEALTFKFLSLKKCLEKLLD